MASKLEMPSPDSGRPTPIASTVEFKVIALGSPVATPKTGAGVRRNADARGKFVAEIAPGATLLGAMGIENAKKLVDGKTVELPDKSTMTTSQPTSLACDVCGGIHGAPRGDRKEWSVERLALILFLVTKAGKWIKISSSCLQNYLIDTGSYKQLTNAEDVRKAFKIAA